MCPEDLGKDISVWYDLGLPIRDTIGDAVYVPRVSRVSPEWFRGCTTVEAAGCESSGCIYGPSVSIRSRSGGSTRGECLMSDAVSAVVADAIHEAALLMMHLPASSYRECSCAYD